MENKHNKYNNIPFLWETHGIHVGTGKDHVKHGIDDVESVVEKAIEKGFPAVTFIIHTPRLTGLRYRKEKSTDIKFIRGDRSYFHYPAQMAELKKKYDGKIKTIWGIELEWMGTGLGLQWHRSKLLHAFDDDYVIGYVHFSPEGLPYDGSKEEAEELVELRGG
ncbi:MAG: PHP domain-containing protein, partial [bacterium]|nr:PHP domain-containing protein [bacterium]